MFIVILFFLYLYPIVFNMAIPESRSGQDELKAQLAENTDSPGASKGLLHRLLRANPGRFTDIIENPDKYQLQIIYTTINRDRQNQPSFQDHYLNADKNRYFYPASTVKMPVAILALQKLRTMAVPGLDMNSTLLTEAGESWQTPVFNDPQSVDGRPTVAGYVKKIFLVSDNDAYNRLYEWLGPAYINKSLQGMGYPEVQIRHRLESALSETQQRITNPVRFLDTQGRVVYLKPAETDSSVYTLRNDFLGKAFLRGGQLHQEPMDFSLKNRISLFSLHQILRAVIFPRSVPERQRFRLSEADYQFLYRYMRMAPAAAGYPPYDPAIYNDTYCKFILFGADKSTQVPEGLHIFNKVGDAYGHLLDIAYIADTKNKIEFMVSAVIYCNEDGVLNDDKYEYDTLGLPFLKHLGEVLYRYELSRSRSFRPQFAEILPKP